MANFITRSTFTGVELQGDYNFIDGSDDNYSLSGLVGFELGDRGNLVVGAGYQHRSELGTPQRDFVNVGYDQNPSAYSALATPGLFAVSYFDTTTSTVNTLVRPDAGCTDLGGTVEIGRCYFTYVPFDNITEDEDRYQAFAELTVDLSDSLRFRMDALYARSELKSLNYSPSFPPTQGPRGSGFVSAFTTSPANPGVAAFLDQVGLPQSSATNPIVAVTNVLYRPFGYLGNPLDPDRGAGTGFAINDAYRISGGFEFRLSDTMTLNIDGTFFESDRTFAPPGIVGSRLQAALNGFGGANCTGTTPGENGCEYFDPFANAGPGNGSFNLTNPFYVPGNENSQALVSWLQAPNGTQEQASQFVFDVVLAGETDIEFSGGPLAFAVGGQFRDSRYTSDPLNPKSNLDVNPCFVEGDRSCVGTTTDGVGSFIFLGDSRPVQLNQDVYAIFAELNAPISDRIEISAAVRYEDYGSPVGSTINPKGSIRFEATDWLTFRGSVGTTFRGPLASNVSPNFVTALEGFTAAGGNYKSKDIYGNPTNLGPDVKIAGLDFALNADFPIGDNATLSFGANAVWNLDYSFDDFIVQGVNVQPAYDAVGFGNYFRDPNTVPEWRANAFVNMRFGDFNARYSVQHIDGVTDDRCVNRTPCFTTATGTPTTFGVDSGSYTQHDVSLTYDLELAGADVQLQASVENFTDAEPAQAQLPLGYNPFIGNALGRNYRLGIRTRF